MNSRSIESCPASVPVTQTDSESLDKLHVYRIVIGFLFASLVWKFRMFPILFAVYRAVPLQDDFFPALMRSVEFLAVLYFVPLVLIASVLFVSHRGWILFQAIMTCLAMFGLCIHQQSYNDVTFVTCWWTSAWCVWYALRMREPAPQLYFKAGRLAVLILSLIFLGGAMGKLTPGYWSGEVLYQIYFVERDFWAFNLLRSRFEPETLREIATYYSRMICCIELAGAGLWLLPTRVACALAIGVLMSIAVFSNTYLFSVMCCLFGLGIAGLHQPASAAFSQAQAKFQSRPISKLIAE